MLSEDRVKGSFGIGIGILLGLLRQWLWMSHVPLVVTLPLIVIATLVFTAGCVFYAQSKGFPRYLGILGLLWVPGLVVLILLPDRKDTFMKELSDELDKRRTARRNGEKEEKANVSSNAP